MGLELYGTIYHSQLEDKYSGTLNSLVYIESIALGTGVISDTIMMKGDCGTNSPTLTQPSRPIPFVIEIHGMKYFK